MMLWLGTNSQKSVVQFLWIPYEQSWAKDFFTFVKKHTFKRSTQNAYVKIDFFIKTFQVFSS